ncbi:MAG: penicillin-binding protein 2 [Coriobacteriia bacterium]|nr:penicillin-binding protein 2 [Coriobacteriia bacterium]
MDTSTTKRLLLIGLLVLAIGVVLVFRLWTLQVIQYDHFQDRANNNLRRVTTSQAIRGRIFDREGRELVTNRPTMAVTAPALRIDSFEYFDDLSEAQQEWVGLLAQTLDMEKEEVVESLTTRREGPLEPRLLAIDVPIETISYIAEHAEKFEGVEVEARAVREYPHGSVAAHVLGYTGGISDEELELEAFDGYFTSDIVGKTGVELSFEHILQGVRGTRVLEVNAQGRLQRVVEETDPTPGQDIYLTIDLDIQRAAERALPEALRQAQRRGYSDARAGSAIVMDPNTGEILAMASYPTYDPSEFLGRIHPDRWAELIGDDSDFPLTNRAISSPQPPASTFKSFMTVAAIDRLDWDANRTYVCTGTWTGFGDQWPWRCWLRSGHGGANLYRANFDSCDIPFYEMGRSFHHRWYNDGARDGDEEIQEVVRSFGYGRRTGIDLPGEHRGRVPDAEWKYEFNRDFPEYRQWIAGDTVNMSIGQGDMLATPLQVAYSHIPFVTGGTALRPQLLHSIRDSRGEVIREMQPEESEIQPEVSEYAIEVIRDSLRLVVTQGTGRSTFSGFPVTVAGKTGTAETGRRDPRTGERDRDSHNWFVGYAPANDPQYLAVVMTEHSGGGIAAPAVRQIFAEIFEIEEGWIDVNDPSR